VSSSARILIFAKAPEPGRVKTRLVPTLTPGGAAALHARLLAGTVQRLARARPGPIELWCAPSTDHDLFRRLARTHGLMLRRQEGDDLGERMRFAAVDALGRADAVVLVGTDCPPLDGAYVCAALRALKGRDAVLGPAEDGGYVLLGVRRAAPALFRDIPWGGGRVAELTRGRMRALGWAWLELATLWDLDRPADLARFRRESPMDSRVGTGKPRDV
jgi:rSAM/selenodomain-associated transferase 1